MRGGADDAIRERFSELAEAAAMGLLDHWADTPRGRLALIVALDQFSRSVWRGTPGAFAQDIRAGRLALEGLENGDYAALPNVWEKAFVLIALCHCEGPEHLARVERSLRLCAELVEAAPERLRMNYKLVEDQNRLALDVIGRFGRHPHRNAVLGRISTPEEAAYIATGEFPHARKLPSKAEEVEAGGGEGAPGRQLISPAWRMAPRMRSFVTSSRGTSGERTSSEHFPRTESAYLVGHGFGSAKAARCSGISRS
jgi:uncharacterized protein (DUF924 family)